MSVDGLHAPPLGPASYYHVKISKVVDYQNTTGDGDRRSSKSLAVPAAGGREDAKQLRIAPQLAAAIEISRAFGTLTGPVSTTFLNGYNGAGSHQTASVERTLDFIDSATRAPSNPPPRAVGYNA